MKVSTLQNKLLPALPLLCCPLCEEPFQPNVSSLQCLNGHTYDLSSRGYVNLAPGHDQRKEKYDAELFASRQRIFEAGFYIPILETVETMLDDLFGDAHFTIADIGCGEGYYAQAIAKRFSQCLCCGLDISRDGIQQAARSDSNVHWLVADLKHLPIKQGMLDAALDILTPADYAAFKRALKPDGTLIKVIPGNNYLMEIRQAVAPYLRDSAYDNHRVVEHLERHVQILERVSLQHTYSLTPEQSADFLRMTPMTFSVSESILSDICISHITIHMEVLRCRML